MDNQRLKETDQDSSNQFQLVDIRIYTSDLVSISAFETIGLDNKLIFFH